MNKPNREFETVIDADALYAAGVSKIELVEGEALELCRCGHQRDTHDPCCVSACGCDGFEPRKPSIEELFKAAMCEIKELAQEALGYQQICDPIQAVRRLAQEFNVLRHAVTKNRAEMADARNVLLFKEKADAIARIAELEAQPRIVKTLMSQNGQVFALYLSNGQKVKIQREGQAAWMSIEPTPIVTAMEGGKSE